MDLGKMLVSSHNHNCLGSFRPGISHAPSPAKIGGVFLTTEPPGKPKNEYLKFFFLGGWGGAEIMKLEAKR